MKPHSENTVLRRLLTGSVMSIINMIIGIVIALFMTPFLISSLGERQMGMWILVGSFTGFYGLLDFGVTSAVSRYLTLAFTKNDTKACNSYASIGFFIFLIMGTIAAFIAFLIAVCNYLTYRKTVDDIGLLALVTIVLGINFMFDFPLRVFSGIITGCLRHDLNNIRELIFRLLGATLTFAIVYSGGKIFAMSLGNVVITLISAVSFYWLAKQVFPQLHLASSEIQKENFKPIFNYSVFSSLASITDVLRFRISSIVIAGFLSIEVITHYGIATALVSYFQQTMGHCTGWLTNWFTRLDAKNDKEAIRTHTMFAYKITVLLATFITFGLIFWSPAFIERWVGAKFLDAYDSLILLTFGMMFAMWQSPTTRVLYATANHHYYSAVNAIDATLNVTLTLLLVPQYGMVGVAIGNCAAMLITKMFILPQVIIRILKISNIEYWGNLGTALAKSMTCLILPYFITQRLLVPEYKWLVLNGAICAGIYFPCAFCLILNKREREKISGIIIKRKGKKNES